MAARRPTPPPRRPRPRPSVATRKAVTTRNHPRGAGLSHGPGYDVYDAIDRARQKKPPAPKKPTAAAPAAPVAQASVPQYSLSSLPPDASYEAVMASLAKQRDEGLASIAGDRSRGLSEYGFSEGSGGALAVDPNNAFSKAALLKKTYDTSRRSTGQAMAAGGQLYSGAYQNAQDLTNRNQLQSEDAMQKSLIGFLARNTGQTKEAHTGYETAGASAYADRVGRFETNPLYQPAEAPAAKAKPWEGRATKTARGKKFYQGQSGKWIPY